MINTAEKVIFAMLAISSLSILGISTLGIEVTIAIGGLFAAAYLVLEREPVKQKMKKTIKRIKN